jgi:hypothetical protein
VAIAAGLAVVAGARWHMNRSGDRAAGPALERDPARRVTRARAATPALAPDAVDLSWLAEPGVAPRRVAGRAALTRVPACLPAAVVAALLG